MATVRAVFSIVDYYKSSSSTIGAVCSGKSVDSVVDFTGEENSTINVTGIDWESGDVNSDIESRVMEALQLSPYNMIFDTSDTVLLLPT